MIKLKTLIFESLSPIEAEQIFSRYGVPNAFELSKEDLKKAWRELSKAFHPDKNPLKKDEMNLAMQWINSAYFVLKNSPTKSGEEKSYDDYYSNNVYQKEEPADYDERQKQRKERYQNWKQNRRNAGHRTSDTHYAGWAQAGWSGGLPNNDHIYNKNFHDLNYCKKMAWEISGRPKFTRQNEYTLWDWDGSYFRGVFSVYAKPEKMFEISKMMVEWDRFYKSVAVFYSHRTGKSKIYLVNLRGKKVNPPKEFEHDSFNTNPGNDNSFVNYLRKNL